ncbi:anion exchange 2-like isoform X2, partial [Brachionus plicatilis]
SEQSIKGISFDAEACKVLVGCVDFLDRPVMGFVRLVNSQNLDDFAESNIKVRFIFVLLGPRNENIDYIEIGRCIGTLMTNKEFHECAYQANDRRDLIEGISYFTNKSLCLVLPLGEFDSDLVNPIVEWMRDKMKHKLKKLLAESMKHNEDKSHISPLQNRYKKSISLSKDPKNKIESEHLNAVSKIQSNHLDYDQDMDEKNDEEFDPFRRTGRPFGSLILEIKYRYSKYWSDFKDALNIHCLIAFVFLFTVCIASALSFGGILADKTTKRFGVSEMLIATSMNGIIFGLFSGQPLMILGPTGPFLVFEEMLYQFCRKVVCLDFLAIRCWVAAWVLLFAVVMLGFETIYVIQYVTRFTEEIFAFLIATVFLLDALKKIIKIFNTDPLYVTEKYCTLDNTFWEKSMHNITEKECIFTREENEFIARSEPRLPSPNVALLSLILMIGTFAIAICLKKLRRSIFLGARARRTLSDVGMLISIILMVAVDNLINSKTGLNTQKLDFPNDTLGPTEYRDQWLVIPWNKNLPIWVPLAAFVPALLIFIVLFFELELTGMILYAKHRKLKKGTGFHLDLLILAILMNVNSFFGLPWMCSAPVRTLAHWASLTVYSKAYIPGEKPKLIDVKEQRLTNICVHLAIGLCLLAKSVLKMIPVSVLFGIFLYFGFVSLSGTQLFERIKLIFTPSKYCPNVIYARGVRPSKRNIYTFIQIFFVLILLLIKSLDMISSAFPIVFVILVPIRLFLVPKLFTHKELEQLDNHNEMMGDFESTLDFYELTHLPI